MDQHLSFEAASRPLPAREGVDPGLRVITGSDVLTGGITIAASLLLVGTGTSWLGTLTGMTEFVGGSQVVISSTLLLNLALILLGWRRFRDLRAEIARRTAAEERALALARFDALTGLLNRRALMEEAGERMREWAAAGSTSGALVIDIDTFKSVNDLFGHSGGDTVIAETAERIRDAAPDGALLARLGGDEFAMVLPLEAGQEGLLDEIGESLAQGLSLPVRIDGVSASTSASIGGAVADKATASLEDVLRLADSAMYRAKRLGRCRYSRFDEEMGSVLARRDLIERELRIAITENRVYPVYEPLIDLSAREAVGYEMLARWKSDTLGEIGPAEFIPVAEEKGLISLLSAQLFRRAMTEARDWPEHLSLSLNVSPLQLRDPWFAQKMLLLLTETGFPGHRLIIEITESAIVDNLPLAESVFTSLRNQGIRMALDDFGTGYSSIASLRALPFDSVKIDREYIARMTEGSTDTIAEAVLRLGRSLGLPVVAEGIETLDAADRLSALDCAVGQGHYFGCSLSSNDIIARHRIADGDGARQTA